MKTICGMSMRGAAYFGASVHICIGIIFFALFLDRLVHQVYHRNLNVEGLRVDKESVIYFGLFLPLGILIFKAIDKENKTLLKWSSAVFLTLQLFGMIIKIKFGSMYSTNLIIASRGPYPGPKLSTPDIFVENFKIIILEIVSTVTYLVTLYFYARQLECFPGRIYGQGSIPMYSTNSQYFAGHRGSHHNRMTTPFTYNFEPPPPYSSVNNLATSADGQGQSQFHVSIGGLGPQLNQQQPCSSRSMFSSIGRNISFKKSNHIHTNPSSNVTTASINCNNSLSANPNPTESDSPSAPLLDSQNDPEGSGRLNHHDNSLPNLKDVD